MTNTTAVGHDTRRRGVSSYRQLVRILARVFYAGEIPPREQLIETTRIDDSGDLQRQHQLQHEGMDGTARKKHPWMHSYEGLGILLLDFLTSDKVDGFVDEAIIASELRLSSKFIRKTLRYLEGEHLLVSESVKFAFKRNTEEEPDDPDIEIKKRHETHVFWAVDYPRVLDIVRLKIHGIEALLKRNSGNSVSIMMYQCPSCGAEYTSLQAASLIDIEHGVFRCEDCSTVLEERGGEEVAGFVQTSSNKERQNFFKDLTLRFDAQIKPVIQQIDALRGVDPPDPGSLKDWYTTQKNEATRRAQRLEEARQKFKSSGASGAADMTEEQLLEWADRAEMVIALPGQTLQSSQEEEGKELPAWFKKDIADITNGAATRGSEEVNEGFRGTSGQSQQDSEQQRELQMEYLQQYLRQIEAQQNQDDQSVVQSQVKDEDGIKKEEPILEDVTREEEPASKKIKREEEILHEQETQQGDHHEDEDIDWEDA